MKLSSDTSQNIADEYCVLHEEIKTIARLPTPKIFNSKTFANEAKRSTASKKPFYILSALSIGLLGYAIFSAINTSEILQYIPEPPALETKEKIKETSIKLTALITLNFLGGSLFLAYKACQIGDILSLIHI